MGYLNTTKAIDLEPLVEVNLLMGDTVKAINICNEILELGKQPDGVRIHNYKFLGDFGEKIGNDTIAVSFYYQGGLYDDVERLLWKHKDFNGAKQFIEQHVDSIRRTISKEIFSEREINFPFSILFPFLLINSNK